MRSFRHFQNLLSKMNTHFYIRVLCYIWSNTIHRYEFVCIIYKFFDSNRQFLRDKTKICVIWKQLMITCTFVMHTESAICSIFYILCDFLRFPCRDYRNRVVPFVGRSYSEHKWTRWAFPTCEKVGKLFIYICMIQRAIFFKFSFYSLISLYSNHSKITQMLIHFTNMFFEMHLQSF